jgi:hypothetical protein
VRAVVSPVAVVTVFSPGAQSLLPRGGDLGCQVEALDAGMVAFEVFPEHVPQVRGEASQAAVVQRRCAFAQVVHQQVTNRPAGEVEPVDELGGGALTGAAQLLQPWRRVRPQDSRLVQRPIERDAVGHRAAVGRGLGVEQLQDIPDGDLGDHAAVGGEDDRGTVQRVPSRRGGQVPVPIAHLPQPGESRGVTGESHASGEGPAAGHRADEPRGARPQDVGADRDRQRRAQRAAQPLRPIGRAQPLRGDLAPVRARGVRAAGQPAVLPALTGLCTQPVQQRPQPATALLLGAGRTQEERCAGQPVEHLLTALSRHRPPRGS